MDNHLVHINQSGCLLSAISSLPFIHNSPYFNELVLFLQ